MKNSLNDLNNHLFAALERLNDESLKGDDLTSEVSRSTAIVGVAESILHNADTQLRAVKILNRAAGLAPRLCQKRCWASAKIRKALRYEPTLPS